MKGGDYSGNDTMELMDVDLSMFEMESVLSKDENYRYGDEEDTDHDHDDEDYSGGGDDDDMKEVIHGD